MPGMPGGMLRRVRHRVSAAREAAATRGDSGMTAIEFCRGVAGIDAAAAVAGCSFRPAVTGAMNR